MGFGKTIKGRMRFFFKGKLRCRLFSLCWLKNLFPNQCVKEHLLFRQYGTHKFYKVLPSSTKNSDDIHPTNTASAFQIRLPKTMYLRNKYEVVLAEMTYPHTWSTFNYV